MVKCDIQLPASKSESNRALMIASYGGFVADIQNLSDSDDTLLLKQILEHVDELEIIDARDCGTAARFLLTYLACREGSWLLTGAERMRQRPMQELIASLRKLGADIRCVEQEGFLPVRINGKPLRGGNAVMEVSKSSQFASSLLLAAPMWSDGLLLELQGQLNSLPYIDMTINMMRHFGASVVRTGRLIRVAPEPYRPKAFAVESDWSAASYWFEIAALSDDCDILLKNINIDSLQGDAKMIEFAESLGVCAAAEDHDLRLKKMPLQGKPILFDFSDTPDLFPTVVATCVGLGIGGRFMGIRNLTIKESDRVEAMTTELRKIGAQFCRLSTDELVLTASSINSCDDKNLIFNTYNDHRIAMALAPLQMKIGRVEFDHPEVVGKSYPHFWDDFMKCN